MRKKRLMELKPLKVMNRHIADAKKTEISLSTLEKQRGEPGKYRMYCRAAVEKGILKVYLFAVTDIEENINFPRYRLFISRKERRFITYDEKLKKWRKALLESILWDARIDFGNIYVNDCDTKVIQKYLKTMQPAIRALEEFQANIRKEQRIRHDQKLTDSWDQVMKTVSGLPKNWIGWVSKYGITEHYIFYKYQKNGANASSVRNRAKTTECSIEASLDHFIKKARMEIQPSVFIFRDKTYRSLEECCLEYGVNADSVSSRKYRLNCTMEESLEHFIENKDMIAERIQKFTFKGIEYRSLRACCQKYGIDDICVRQRARDKNCSLEESFTHFMTRKRKKMLSNPEFEYHGTVYPSLKVCCEELGINKSSVISRSHRAGCSLQEAVEYYVSQQERRTLD